MQALLRARVDVNAPEGDGTTALHWAVQADDVALARTLIRAGAKVTAANRLGVTPLALAATNGSAAADWRACSKAGANPNEASPEGETVLMTAARTGKVPAVERAAEGRRGRERHGDMARRDGADVGGGREPRRGGHGCCRSAAPTSIARRAA